MSALGEFQDGADLPPYDHLDPYPSFLETKLLIAKLLESISPGPDFSLVFKREEGRFSLDLPSFADDDFVVFLSLRSDLNPEDMKNDFSSFGKLSSSDRLDHLISRNLPGVQLSPLREAPVGLPRRRDTVYFAIRRKDPLWEEALKSKRLSLFWDKAPESAVVILTGNRL
jgi:type VI secretion system protein ImpJ